MPRPNTYLRDLESQRYREERLTPDYEVFARESIYPLIKFTGYKIDAQCRIAEHIAHNLIVAGISGACVSDSRDWHVKGAKARSKIWDQFAEAGLADVCLGSELAGKVTRYRATRKLLDLRREWELKLLVDTGLAHNTELEDPTDVALLVLRPGKMHWWTGHIIPDKLRRQPVSLVRYCTEGAEPGPDGKADPQAVQNCLDWHHAIEDFIEGINRNNLLHTWKSFRPDVNGKLRVIQPNPCLRKICIGHMQRAGRFYTSGLLGLQSLPKAVRQTLLIDDEPTVELDYGGMAPRMVYHDLGIDPPGDVYRPDQILPAFHALRNASQAKRDLVRGFIKRATNILLNTTGRPQANAAVARLLVEDPKRDFLDRALRLDGLDAKGVVQRIVAAHPQIATKFFTGCGVHYMGIDGQIMSRILESFEQAKRPACGLHDAVLCKATDADFAEEKMVEHYRRFFVFDPVIKRS